MMKAKLIVEGKEFPIEIQDPKLKELLMPKKKTGYERVDSSFTYFITYVDGTSLRCTECNIPGDKTFYDGADYYSDETVAKNNARADKLMRQLRRFAVEHRKDALDWSDNYDEKYFIQYNYGKNCIDLNVSYACLMFGGIYFDTEKAAKLAIETFHDELIWYFTEYKDSL